MKCAFHFSSLRLHRTHSEPLSSHEPTSSRGYERYKSASKFLFPCVHDSISVVGDVARLKMMQTRGKERNRRNERRNDRVPSEKLVEHQREESYDLPTRSLLSFDNGQLGCIAALSSSQDQPTFVVKPHSDRRCA